MGLYMGISRAICGVYTQICRVIWGYFGGFIGSFRDTSGYMGIWGYICG